MDLFTYLMAKKGHNTHRDLFSYLLGKNAGGSGTYTTFSGTSLNISNTLQAKIKNIALEGNTSQDGTPTPDTPIPIKVVTGEQNVTIQNKNLLDTSESNTTLYAYFNSTNGSVINDGTKTNCIFNEYIKVEPNTSYTISSNKITNSSIYTYVEYDKNKNFLNYYSTGSLPTKEKTFVTGSNTAYIRIRYKWSTGVTITNEIIEDNDIQLEIGEVATTYVPYQSQTYPLSLGNIKLARISKYKDYIFKNEVGSPYYNANLELNEWYLHKEIDKLTLNGSETWTNQSAYGGKIRFRTFNYQSIINSMVDSIGYSNYFKNNGDTYTNNGIFGNSGVIQLRDDNLFASVSDVTNWLSEHNTIVYYIKKTPRNTKITDTTLVSQLENTNNNARSYKDTTYIICSSESTDNEVIGFSGDIKVTSAVNSLNTSLLSSNIQEETNIDDIQEEPNLDDVNEIEDIEQNDEPIENEEIEEPSEEYQEL